MLVGVLTVKLAMYLRIGLPMYGCVKWKCIASIRNLRNVRNVSCSRGVEVVQLLLMERLEIFMEVIPNAGGRLWNESCFIDGANRCERHSAK
jgi:hypothetical protein